MTFAELEYDSKKRRTRREIFLEKMEGLIPWQQLEDRIEPEGWPWPPSAWGERVHCVSCSTTWTEIYATDAAFKAHLRTRRGRSLSGR